MNNAQGIDVSKWDEKPIDFSQYKNELDFVSVKVSEGLTIDPLFKDQWQAARGHTIRFPYHFWHSLSNQKQSVGKMLEFMAGDQGEIDVALDLEVDDGSTEVMTLAQVWCDEYHYQTGGWPIIYSSRSFLHKHGADYQTLWERLAGVYHNAWLSKCKLWLAEWPFDELDELPGYTQKGDELRAVLIQEVIDGKRALTWPKPIPPFKQVDIWQWTSRFPPARIPGYYMGANHKLAVDHNLSILPREVFKSTYPLQTGEQTGVTMQYKIIWQNGAAERSGAGINFPSTGKVYVTGSIVQVVRIQANTPGVAEWGQLDNGNWIATIYNSQPRAALVSTPPPPDPTPDPETMTTHVSMTHIHNDNGVLTEWTGAGVIIMTKKVQ